MHTHVYQHMYKHVYIYSIYIVSVLRLYIHIYSTLHIQYTTALILGEVSTSAIPHIQHRWTRSPAAQSPYQHGVALNRTHNPNSSKYVRLESTG